MAKLTTMTIGIPGVEVDINYNAQNLRITTVEWILPNANLTAHVWIWNSGTLAYNRTIAGPATGTENVPGSHDVVEYPIPGGGIGYVLPAYLTYQINIETVGQ